VFVIGDLAHVAQPDGSVVPGVAQGALQMGTFVGAALTADRMGRPRGAFRYRDKGNMATIGRRRAVAETPQGWRLHGTPAWLAWLGLHVGYLAGGRNRVSVIADWGWNYLAWGIGPRRAVIE
jgi:NADH dehydrogenase